MNQMTKGASLPLMAITCSNTTELLREKVARSRNVSIDFLFDEKNYIM